MMRIFFCAAVVAMSAAMVRGAEFNAAIIKIDGSCITYQKYKKANKSAIKDGDPVKIEVAKDASIERPMIGPKDARERIEGGLKADLFNMASETNPVMARLTIDENTNKVTRILVVPTRKK